MVNLEEVIKLMNIDKEESNGKKVDIHYVVYINIAWVIIFLVVLICITCSVKITCAKDTQIIIQFITNFATLLSIILSISSILFAYYTSRDTNNQYIKMSKALEEIRVTNIQMSINNVELVSQINDIAKDVGDLNNKYDLSKMFNDSRNNVISIPQTHGNVINGNLIANQVRSSSSAQQQEDTGNTFQALEM